MSHSLQLLRGQAVPEGFLVTEQRSWGTERATLGRVTWRGFWLAGQKPPWEGLGAPYSRSLESWVAGLALRQPPMLPQHSQPLPHRHQFPHLSAGNVEDFSSSDILYVCKDVTGTQEWMGDSGGSGFPASRSPGTRAQSFRDSHSFTRRG